MAVNGTPAMGSHLPYGLTQCYLPPDTLLCHGILPLTAIQYLYLLPFTFTNMLLYVIVLLLLFFFFQKKQDSLRFPPPYIIFIANRLVFGGGT